LEFSLEKPLACIVKAIKNNKLRSKNLFILMV